MGAIRVFTGVSPVKRAQMLVVASVTLIAASCVPPAPPPPPPPPAAVLSPTSGAAGSFINVTVPDTECTDDGTWSYLEASLTIQRSGVVISTAWASVYSGTPVSSYVSPDPVVRLRVPPATRLGTYVVYLSCQNYLDSFLYSGAKYRVTS